ncbi:MAG: hypothetical protein EOP49_00690 [Sphingobacteriales bacterium]|nr:MAG: hypothetical protein EOP49_00690 [Sphingobacteriales bacterium]
MRRIFSLLAIFQLMSLSMSAQTTVTTSINGGLTYVAPPGPGVLVFGVRNNNTDPITITSIANYLPAVHSQTYSLWYNPTTVAGLPGAISTANGWIQLATPQLVSNTTGSAGIMPVFTGLSLVMPSNAIFRFAIQVDENGPYYGGSGSTPNLFSNGGVDILAQNHPLSASYAGGTGGPTNTPRSFYGSITFSVNAGPACSGNPVAGATVIVPGYNCANFSTSLALSGNTSGGGQTYQWQSSPDNTPGSYTNFGVAGGNSGAGVTPVSTTWYRAVVTCGSNSDTSTPVQVHITPQLSGTYSINAANPTDITSGGSNFASFTDAANALYCGITGPVTFNVAAGSGPYTEQVSFPIIPGASATNTITINGNGNTLQATPVTANRYVLQLNGADRVSVNNLTIKSLDLGFGWGVHLMNGADNNSFNNCNIEIASTNTSQSNSGGIVASNSLTAVTSAGNNCNNLSITNCTITGGYQGIIINGNTNGTSAIATISNNIIKDFYANGIEVTNCNGGTISGNDINRMTRVAVTTFAGIEVGAGCRNLTVNANKIHDTHNAATTQSGTAYGIYSNASDAPSTEENIFSNNLIYNFNSTTGTQYGIYNLNSNGAYYFHNTIVLNHQGSSSGVTRGFNQSGDANNIFVKNNIFYLNRSGTGIKYGLYLNTATSVVTADFNDYYNNSLLGTNGIAFLGSGYNNLAAWQASNGQAYDQNSVSMDPQFVSLAGANFIPANPLLDNLGTPITAVITDYSGATRSTTTPDIGAFEFSTGACTGTPVAGTATISVIGTQCPNTSVTFSLNGSSLGTGLTYQWQTSATNAPGSYTNAGTSSTNMAYTATLPITAWYRAVVTCNGLGDTSAPVVVNVYPGFSGTFTIDGGAPTGNGNFQSFADAVSAMACGIVGPVVFNVVAGSGPYNEQVVIPQISGTSATNTVTINGNGETIEFASTTSASRSGIYLNGADFVTINELNIDGTAGTYGWGVHFMNSADNNTITGCNIRVSNINDATNAHCPIVMNNSTSVLLTGGSSGTGNTVTGCTLIGGYYNVVLAGASASNITTNNTLTNNIIRDAYSYSVYVEFHSNALIKGNDISRPARATSTNSAGVYLSSGLGITVQDNKIHNMFDAMPTNTSIFYGVGGLADGTAASPNKLINNLIYNIAGQGTHYGIFSSTAPYMEAYHNTISFDNTAATAGITYGIYQTGTALGNIFRNNIIYITRGGSGVKYGIYKNTAGNAIVSNNNVFYVNSAGSGVQGIGYQTSAQTTLANWQAASGNDANSIVVDPNFTDPGAGDFTPTVVQTNNMGANVGVLTDIFGNPRSTTTPDPGAIEFNVVACVAPPTSGTVTQSVMSLCSGQNVTLGLNGNSTGAGQTYQWESSTSALPGSWTAIGTPSITTSLTTAVATNTYFRAAVTCSGNTVYTPEILVAVNDPFAGGFYTINSTLPTDIGSGGVNFQSFNDAVLAISCGITGPVVFDVTPGTGPYVEQVVFPATITGTSAANTITFNGNGNTIRFASTDANRRAVIRLDGTDHVTFNDLVVEAIGSTSTEYAWGIHLFGDADFNTINNCTINAGTAGITTANFAGIVINGSLTAPTTGGTGNGNVVSNNTIIGGYYGILCSGTSGSVNAGNIITDNNVREFYTYGIYTTYNNGILIEDNNIQRPTRLNVSTFYGVALSTGSVGAQVNRNIIHNPFGGEPTATSATYGLYVAADATAANPNKLTNNLIYNINGNGINYLLHNAGGDHAWYYHNTVSSELATSTATGATYGFYQTTSATGVEVRNNIISIKRGGTGAKYGIYMNTPASAVNSDNNVLFLDAQNANVGYKNSIAYLTLPLWQAAGSDLSSFDVDPAFTDPATADFTPTTGTFDNQGVPLGVLSDIMGTPRSATPDIGAYEFSALLCAGTPLNPGTVTGPTTAICNGNPAQLEIADYPTDAGITLQWEYYDVAGSSWQPVALATDPVLSLTGMTNTTDYRVAVTCTSAGGGTAYSNIVTVTVVNPQITGTTPVSNCGAGSVTLGASATPGAVINWYDSPTSITPLATGPNFVTPIIGSTTTYFASAGNGGYTVFTGRTAPNPGTAASTANYGQVFTVTTPMILNSVEVRSTTGTSMTVSLYNGGGTSQLQTTGANTVPTNSTNTIALGWSLAPGTYRLVANAITGSFLRESSGITYPIALATAGQITAYHTSLTGAPNTGAAYNYFYNWNITVGCESPRTPVTATIAPSVAITATGSDDTVCMGTPVQLSASSSNANYSYTWTPGGSGATVSVTPAATTTYYVNAFDNGSNCTAVDSFKVTVKSVDPAIATVANPEEICVTGQVTVSLDPAPAFGITYQWQADNGSGFSDIPG